MDRDELPRTSAPRGGSAGSAPADAGEHERALEQRLRAAEVALAEREAELKYFRELNPQVPWTAGPDGRVDGFNQRWLDLTGLTREEALGEGWLRAPHPDDLPLMAARWTRAVETGGPYDVEHRIRLADGSFRWMRSRAYPARDDQGRIVRWYGTTEDIHERRIAEDALRASEGRFRLAAQAIHAIVYEYDFRTGRAFRTRGLMEVLGWDPGDVPDVAEWWLDQLHPDDRDRLIEETRAFAESHATEFRFEYRARHRDGHWVYIEDRAVVERDAEGRALRQVGCSQDVTRIRANEIALRDRAEELSALMEATPAVTFIAHDAEATLITGNRAARELLRMSASTNLSKSAPPGEAPAHFTVWDEGRELSPDELPVQRAARGDENVRDFEEELRFDDGTVVTLFGSAVPLRGADGRARGAVSAFVDVTRLKEAERALRDADRRKDEFLAMLAHELRNPLAPIRNAVEVLKRIGPAEAQLVQMRETIERQVGHLARMVDDLLDVSRITQDKIALRRETLEVMVLVGRAVETSRPLIDARRHELSVAVAPEPLRVEGDPTRLAQVISNLLNNAAKYTEEGGHIRLSVSRADGDVCISVTDDGIGIAHDVLPHVFDLFAQADRSLDRSQGGLGIGLTLVRRLVEMHGGRVEASSPGLGQGSEFRVYLPALGPDPRASRSAQSERTEAPAQRARVLVVDDSVDSAESMALLLDLDGHDTRMAHSGPAALDAARDFAPDVVLLDIGLPGMDGYEVARRLREASGASGPSIVALTGYGRPEDRMRAIASGCHYHLTKPVDFGELGALVRSLVRQ